MKLFLLFLILCSSYNFLHAAVTATEYTAIRNRFPELNLPATQPTSHDVSSATELTAAINSATDGSLIVMRTTAPKTTWQAGSTLTISKSLTLISMDSNGGFINPIILSGNNKTAVISINGTDKTVKLANFVIKNGKTTDITNRGGGLNLIGTTAVTASCLSFIANSASYAASLFVNANATITLFNSTFDEGTGSPIANLITYQAGNIRLNHCTVLGVVKSFTTADKIVQVNCLTSVTDMLFIDNGTSLPHYAPSATSASLDNAATTIENLPYDILGHARVNNGRADLGAVELYTDMEPPTDFVALPSGCREVYIGWPKQSAAVTVQFSINNGSTWTDIPEADLRLHHPRYNSNTGNEVDYNWTNVRHVNRNSGWQAKYRLKLTLGDVTKYSVATQTVTVPRSAVPQLATNPNATRTIFLSFDGYIDDSQEFIGNYRSNVNSDGTYIKTEPYWHGDGSAEVTANAVEKIWKMVADDYAPFDVNVTTIDPGYDALVKSDDSDVYHGIRAVIGQCKNSAEEYVSWFDRGGVSLRNAFNYSYPVPAYAIANNNIGYVATTISHEVGHTIGLNHDGGDIWLNNGGLWIRGTHQEYYSGPNVELTETGNIEGDNYTTDVKWLPIMGGPVYGNNDLFINQWCKGNYATYWQDVDLPENEDDIAIIIGLWNGRKSTKTDVTGMEYLYLDYGIRLKPDDHGDTFETATILPEPGAITALIGKNIQISGSVTNLQNDVDCFKIFAKRGEITANIDIPTEYGSNLDAKIQLFNADHLIIASADLPQGLDMNERRKQFRSAHLSATIPADGTYYIFVSGTGRRVAPPAQDTMYIADGSTSDYVTAEEAASTLVPTDGYGSMGEYTLITNYTKGEMQVVKPGLKLKLK